MYIRFIWFLQTGIALFSGMIFAESVMQRSGVEVLYAPEVVFVGKPLTLRIQSSADKPLAVSTNRVELALPSHVPGETAELSFYPTGSLELEVGSGTEPVWHFKVVRPSEAGTFTERDGFLEWEGKPAVLLPDHRLPPPQDRRWETLEWVKEALVGRKSPIPSIHWYTSADSRDLREVGTRLTAGRQTVTLPDSGAWFNVHGFLLAQTEANASFVALEIDFHDLERGMSYPVWLAKWQFLLQRIQAQNSYPDGLLFGPVFDDVHSDWHLQITKSLRSLAAAHGLRYVDRSYAAREWQSRLLDQLGKEYRLP